MITLIVCVDKNSLIGSDGKIPWHLPADMKHFKKKTLGKVVVMGRKTWDSLPKSFRPLVGRINVVLSRKCTDDIDGVIVTNSPIDAISLASVAAKKEIMVIGGSEIYTLFYPFATKIEMTVVDGCFEGDTYFKDFHPSDWKLVAKSTYQADKENLYSMYFLTFERKAI